MWVDVHRVVKDFYTTAVPPTCLGSVGRLGGAGQVLSVVTTQ